MLWWSLQQLQLKARNPDLRAAAIEKLASSKNPEAIVLLQDLVQDSEITVRQALAKALGNFQDERVVLPLTTLMRDPLPQVREAAATALGASGLAKAQKPLVSALNDGQEAVRIAAARALTQLKWEPKTPEERALIAIATGKCQQAAQEGEHAFGPLVNALHGDTYHLRRAAVEALSRIDDARAIRPLIIALRDKDSHVRVSAVEALGRLGNPEAVDALVSALKDEFAPVRVAATEVLGRIGINKAYVPLTVALRDKSWDVRRAAVEALGRLGDPKAIDSLVQMFKDKDGDVRLSTVRALEALKDIRAVPALVIALTDEQKTVRMAATGALAKICPRWEETDAAHSVIPELETANRSREYWVKQAATEVLTRLQQARPQVPNGSDTTHVVLVDACPIQQLLNTLLSDPDRDFRLAAAEALGRLSGERNRELLLKARQDIDPWVRQAADFALEGSGSPDTPA